MGKGDKVKIVRTFDREPRPIKEGTVGKVIAVRPRIDDQILVKFKGHTWPQSLSPDWIVRV